MKVASITHKGLVRANNEDYCVTRWFQNGSVLLAVADGMGGHAAGEVAARIAAESLTPFDADSKAVDAHFTELLQAAGLKILETSAQDINLHGMGTTLTALFVRDGIAHWAHVGDSRLYLFREGYLIEVTEDHTIIALLLREGEITREEALNHPLKNVLLGCLGHGDFEIDTGSFDVMDHDMLILSTDGLHDAVPEERMVSMLRSNSDLQEKLNALMDEALAAGGRDNITVTAVEMK